jgi:glycosyltransferase involved in cell wall biosynthesis
MIARFHPVKDHGTFLSAIALAAREIPGLRALCIGRGVAAAESGLPARVAQLGIGHICELVEERADLERIYPGIDVACLTSLAEAFPNVLGEAMAHEIPCVATDVGDSAQVLGDTGHLVMPQAPAAVAAAMIEFFRMGSQRRNQLGLRARARIVERYSMPVISARYLELYQSLLEGTRCEKST